LAVAKAGGEVFADDDEFVLALLGRRRPHSTAWRVLDEALQGARRAVFADDLDYTKIAVIKEALPGHFPIVTPS
jgi:hypothetical protein